MPGSALPTLEFDPVYGLPRHAVEEWLARNPYLRKRYEIESGLRPTPPQVGNDQAIRKRKVVWRDRSEQVMDPHEHLKQRAEDPSPQLC